VVAHRSDAVASGALVFFLNGKRVSIPAWEVDPSMTLNDYIRFHTSFTGALVQPQPLPLRRLRLRLRLHLRSPLLLSSAS
jgi:hypothetical protein